MQTDVKTTTVYVEHKRNSDILDLKSDGTCIYIYIYLFIYIYHCPSTSDVNTRHGLHRTEIRFFSEANVQRIQLD
jgi:hypothetical protein